MKRPTGSLLRRFSSVVADGRGQILGERAVEAGLINAAQLRDCQEAAAARPGVPFRQILQERLGIAPQAIDVIEMLVRQDAGARRLAGRYELSEELGHGGMGIVYRATDLQLKRPVAVKLLRANLSAGPAVIARITREAHAFARLNHPNIPAIYDIGETGGLPYLVMELIDGPNLAGMVSQGSLPIRDGVQIIAKIAEAVNHAHVLGIVHRDIKPGNIQLDGKGEPHILDFGLAHLVESETAITAAGVAVGTPLYMSPEQTEGGTGAITAQSDVYALGAVLYELLTGRPPHSGTTVPEIMSRIVNCDPEPPSKRNSRIPADLETVCLKAMDRDPRRRYGSALEFSQDLRRFLEGEAVVAKPVSTLSRVRRRMARHPLAWALAAVVVAIGGIAFELARRNLGTSEKLRGAEISTAWFEAERECREPVLALEDAWHGKPGTDIARQVAAIETSIDRLRGKYPGAGGMLLAWKALAYHYAGSKDKAIESFDVACGGREPDPLAHLLRARASLSEYSREAHLPQIAVGTTWWALGGGIPESAAMAQARVTAGKLMDRALALPLWERLQLGGEYVALSAGTRLLAARRFREAAEKLLHVRQDPMLRDETGWLCGLAFFQAGDFDRAAEVWEAVGRRRWLKAWRGAAVAQLMLAARVMEQKGDPTAALQECVRIIDEALARHPRDVLSLTNRAIALHQLSDLEMAAGRTPAPGHQSAIRDLDLAVEVVPGAVISRKNRASVTKCLSDWHRGRGEFDACMPLLDRAIADLDECMTAIPGHARLERGTVRMDKALLLHLKGVDALAIIDGAVDDLTEAIRRMPRHAEAYNRRNNALHMRATMKPDCTPADVEAALAAAQEWVAAFPEEGGALYSRGACWFNLGISQAARGIDPDASYRQAVRDCIAALERIPADQRVKDLLEKVQRRQGR